MKRIFSLSILATAALVGCNENNPTQQQETDRFKLVAGGTIGGTGLYVYIDKQTGREYLQTTYDRGSSTIIMPEEQPR